KSRAACMSSVSCIMFFYRHASATDAYTLSLHDALPISSVQIAAELQKVGGGLSASLDPDRLLISGNGLITGLDRILEILAEALTDRKSTRLNSSHVKISYAVSCLKKKTRYELQCFARTA